MLEPPIATLGSGSIVHTVKTTIREGIREGAALGIGQSGGGNRLSSVSSTGCVYAGSVDVTVLDSYCGSYCANQQDRETADKYTSGNLTYYHRWQTRLWWTQADAGLFELGFALTSWREPIAYDCNDVNQPRDTNSGYYQPQWDPSLGWRTFDYVWDQSWRPTVTATNASQLVVTTQEPIYYAGQLVKTLRTDNIFN